MQTLTIKDIVYIISLAFTVGTGIAAFSIMRDRIKRLTKTVYDQDNGLNLVTVHSCKTHMDTAHKAIRSVEEKSDKAVSDLTKEVKTLNQNVLRIMIHLKIDTEKGA